ncbi:MAG: 1-deoxy-D-xylulose-5-phosphate synthase, partial [Armatimonadetes bacterium]|nr:1-deoxy-D-xylulose-5-phosphate synthase [Armatimonadota bacterium]
SILNKINSPADLKGLSEIERKQLADDMRAMIIDTVSHTGGHLASNLGAVELTIALHTVFDSPRDKFVWDVSHQCYAHKLLTGRHEQFSTLRQGGGISGFTKREESKHDPIGAGHASTSISAALGLAKARDLRGGSERVIAVIGDGALTGGLALEGMNNAEHLKTDIMVILNDNTMSISENVGAMSLHLSKLRMAPLYKRMETRTKEALEKIPMGKMMNWTVEGLSHGVTRLLGGSRTGVIFEELGFTYLGPIDGHNTELMIDLLEHAKDLKGPLLIHVLTQKGKGYEFAENNARGFHGISGFDVSDGNIERAGGNTSYTRAFSEALVELAAQDDRVVAITAAMPDGTGLAKFAETYPDRFFDVGIAEEHAVTFAAGLAAGGLKPVVALYSTFLQRAYDQIVHDVCLQNLPVVFAIDRAGIVGEDGPTHHGVFDISYLRHIPGLVIAAPKDTCELRDLLATALRHDGPMAIRYPRGGGPIPHEPGEFHIFAIGKGERLTEGKDAAIIALGSTVYPSVEAANILAAQGISVEVINARFAKPLDEQLILGVLNRKIPCVIAEDNTIAGGFGSAILELASRKGLSTENIKIIGVPDAFVEHDTPEALREKLGLTAEGIAAALMSGAKRRVYPER